MNEMNGYNSPIYTYNPNYTFKFLMFGYQAGTQYTLNVYIGNKQLISKSFISDGNPQFYDINFSVHNNLESLRQIIVYYLDSTDYNSGRKEIGFNYEKNQIIYIPLERQKSHARRIEVHNGEEITVPVIIKYGQDREFSMVNYIIMDMDTNI